LSGTDYIGKPCPKPIICRPEKIEIRGLAMGRGRSKAKQTRVARDLKYHSQDIDIEKLSKELHGEVESSDDGDVISSLASNSWQF
jgi:Protein of unknown function (DUF3073)